MDIDKKEQKETKIVLPKELQIAIMDFFLKTSIPRKKINQKSNLSKQDRRD